MGGHGSLPSWGLDQAGFGDDFMYALIVRLDGDGFDDLHIVGDAEAMCFAVWTGEKAVVVAAATAEAESAAGEGETWDEDNVEHSNFEWLTVGFGFPDVHLAALEVFHAMNLTRAEFTCVDLKACQTRPLLSERHDEMREEIGFAFKAAEESDGRVRRP
jgi:hypothetical protein